MSQWEFDVPLEEPADDEVLRTLRLEEDQKLPEIPEQQPENQPTQKPEEDEPLSIVRPQLPAWEVRVGVSSVIGRRSEQQDSVKADEGFVFNVKKSGIAVLCDGMGGLSGGARASGLAVELVHRLYHEKPANVSIAQFYNRAISQADERVASLKDEKGGNLRAGTTMVSVVIDDGKLHWASVGDSRIYIQRRNELMCLTQDHNYMLLLNEKVQRGEMTREQAESEPKKEALISYLGINGVRYISRNSAPLALENGDHIILCSDGLYRSLTEAEMMQMITCFAGDPKSMAEAMTSWAVGKGNRHQDNTSVIVLEFQKNR